jgi:hypothetical protein
MVRFKIGSQADRSVPVDIVHHLFHRRLPDRRTGVPAATSPTDNGCFKLRRAANSLKNTYAADYSIGEGYLKIHGERRMDGSEFEEMKRFVRGKVRRHSSGHGGNA